MNLTETKTIVKKRKCFRVDNFGSNIPIDFETLKEGDKFYLIEPESEGQENIQYATDQYGNTIFIATSDAYYDSDAGVYAIKIANEKKFIFIGQNWRELGKRLNIEKNDVSLSANKEIILEQEEKYKNKILEAISNDEGLLILKEFLKEHIKNDTAYKPFWTVMIQMIQTNDDNKILMLQSQKNAIYEILRRNITLMEV